MERFTEGGRKTSDQTVLAICQTFGVSEKWLRTGEGEMFVSAPRSELEALAAKYPNMTHETFVFIEKLVELSTEKQNIIMGFLKDATSKFQDIVPVPTTKEKTRTEAESYYQQSEIAELRCQLQELAQQNQKLQSEIEAIKQEDAEQEESSQAASINARSYSS